MLLKLFILFIVVPFVELVLLLYLADITSPAHTLGLILITGLVGSVLARSQGWRTYTQIQAELAQGKMPGQAMLDAVLIFVAGALLLTPGILTDLFGMSLLIPPCRAFYRGRLIRWFKGSFRVQTMDNTGSWTNGNAKSEVIDSFVIEDSHHSDDAS